MKRYRSILALARLDEGAIPKRVFERVLDLACRNGAKLTLLDVVDEMELVPEILPREMFESILEARRDLLTEQVEAAEAAGLEVEAEITAGKPFLEIIQRVQRSGHDLVMTGGGSLGGTGGAIDGTTLHLMRKCPCAIWVVRPSSNPRYERILAAVDPGANEPEKESLNRKIIEHAVSMAKLDGSQVHIVHVWKHPGLPLGAAGETWRRWEEAARGEIRRRLYSFLADYDLGADPQIHLLTGAPGAAIAQLTRDKRIDLIVLGTVCRTGVRGFFIGNTAESILGKVGCSLLAVKPRAFVSPV